MQNRDEERYRKQKYSAERKNIKFNISFDDWFNWWKSTGKYHLRGRKKGQYQMARFNDIGPYEIGNIKCITMEENTREGNSGSKLSEEHKRKIGLSSLGNKHTKESKLKISKARKGMKFTSEHRENMRIAAENAWIRRNEEKRNINQ